MRINSAQDTCLMSLNELLFCLLNHFKNSNAFHTICVGFLLAGVPLSGLAQSQDDVETKPIDLEACLRRVFENNFEVKASKTRQEASERQADAEWGVFEPRFIGSSRYEENRRENTRQDFLSQSSPLFEESNVRWRAAMENTLPSGGQLRLGTDVNKLHNNLQSDVPQEYVTFTGATLRQPLLKDAGYETTMAPIKIAETGSDIELHETRRELMNILSQAEFAYWDLYQATKEYEMRRESVRIARDVLEENKRRVRAGNMTEIEVKKAEAELALRRTQLKESRQGQVNASARLKSFMAEEIEDLFPVMVPEDDIRIKESAGGMGESLKRAFDSHPTLQALRLGVDQENLRKDFQRNQRLPQVDVNASYGLNGLGPDIDDSTEKMADNDFYSWFVGIEVNIPMLAGIREKNEYLASRLREREAQERLKAAELELMNLLRAMISRVKSLESQVEDYRNVVELQQSLLDAELSALEMGRTDSREVFQAEQDLTEAKMAEVESLVEYKRRTVEQQVLEGTYLDDRGMDLR